MTDEELIAYFEHAKLPETLRLDRATTQHHVREAVDRNIESMLSDLKDERCRYRLQRIADAMENPYDGPEIPRF
jgi:predicted component of type VI protein secretion system